MARTKQTALKSNVGKSKARKSQPAKASAPAKTDNTKKPHRFKSGTVALREIRRYQKDVHPQLRYLPFLRNVRKITEKLGPADTRWSTVAVHALRELVENRIVNACAFGNAAAIHGKRVTLMPKDLQLKKALCASNQS